MTYGEELYQALKRVRSVNRLRMNYAEQKALRAANEGEALAMLRGKWEARFLARLRELGPDGFSEWLEHSHGGLMPNYVREPKKRTTPAPEVFGEHFYEAMAAEGLSSLLSMTYAELQELKTWTREQVVAHFRSEWDYASVQRLKEETPEEFACFLRHRREMEALAAGRVANSMVWGVYPWMMI